MAKDQAVVISDVHIGNGAPTVWYQPSVHEPYLIEVLDWVVDNTSSVRELVLLGDMFDQWTYPPSVRPPSLAEIIAANSKTLGPSGALARAVKALPGAVTLLLGNHDGTLSQSDVDVLSSSVGQLDFVSDGLHIVEGSSGARTAFAHGHYWTMFNAPDAMSPWNTLPVGHFVTRAFAFEMANKLRPGQTVADLPNMGSPSGFDLGPFLRSLGPTLNVSVAGLLLDYVTTVAQLPKDMQIVLPDGSITSINEAKHVYDNLFTRWAEKEGGPYNAARAAFADQWGEYLVWFAQRLAIQSNTDLVVFGHTHTAVGGINPSPVNYINSGYECPSRPDVPPKGFTFTIVDLEHATGEVFQVAKSASGLQIQPFPAPHIPVVVSPAMDFSCYVTIINQTGRTLNLKSAPSPSYGYWVVPPPAEILAGAHAGVWVQDNLGASGSEASITYAASGKNYKFSFRCPTGIWPNTVSGPTSNFVARSGAGDWGSQGSVPSWGHPLQVRYTVT